jgi:hypothetical protein
MTREITTHKVNGLNEMIGIVCTDEPGPGGANHDYFVTVTNPHDSRQQIVTAINFQRGPINVLGSRLGLSNEALLAIVADRLFSFQSGPYACDENALALGHVQSALAILHKRTRERVARGVEGTMEK